MADELIRLATENRRKWANWVRATLGRAAGPKALERMQKLPPDRSPWGKDAHEQLVRWVKERNDPPTDRPKPEVPDKPEPPAAELAKLREALAGGPEADGFGEAFDTLTRHDPGPVAAYPVAWKNPNKEWRDADRGYVLGSYFG